MKNQIKTIMLLGLLSGFMLLIASRFGPTVFWGVAIFAVLMNGVMYFFSDKMVLMLHRAKEISPEEDPALHRMVEELSQRAGIPKPKVYGMDDPAPNAFATGRNPANGVVAVTSGIRRLLTDRELRGVIAHELAHIKNRDILVATIAAAIAAIITNLANIFQWSALLGGGDDEEEGGNPLGFMGAILFSIIAGIGAMLIQMAISRSREYLADETGGRISGDPEALALALEKLEMGVHAIPHEAAPATASLFIVNPLSGRSLLEWFSTHPPIPERARRLRELAAAIR
ncbi:MAG: Protease HtpX [Myxococcota bacterium]|nr:Protease HtpX [Myxococcota bacterium]